MWRGMFVWQIPKRLQTVCFLIPLLVFGQIVLGLVNVYWFLPDWASVAHLANAILIYLLSLNASLEIKLTTRSILRGRTLAMTPARQNG